MRFSTRCRSSTDGTLLLGFGERGTRAGPFWFPNGLFVDEKDRMCVADSYNQRVSMFEPVPQNRTARPRE